MGNDHLPCSPTTTTVMSSREKLTLCQISVATFTNRYAAVSNYCCWKGIIKVITYSFSRYSQMPSEATTINLSSGLVSNSITSAYPIVPAFIPALSPKERVMARPGIATYFIHTLNGPKSSPLSFFWLKILPPKLMMRYFSSTLSGLWSMVRGRTFHS